LNSELSYCTFSTFQFKCVEAPLKGISLLINKAPVYKKVVYFCLTNEQYQSKT